MNKQEQITEMAVLGCVRNPKAHTAEECAKCDFKQGMCNAYRHAESLYNAGYRKTFTGDLASDTQKEENEKRFENNMKAVLEIEKKQAVKEFAEKLKEQALSHCRIINCYELTFIETTIDELLKEYEK